MAICRQACPYNTLDGCKVKEYGSICQLTNTVQPIADKVIEEANSHSHAVAVLKTYCNNQQDCAKCVFHDGKCKLAHTPPCWWKL